jgi:RNA polymerase sigma-32 factor
MAGRKGKASKTVTVDSTLVSREPDSDADEQPVADGEDSAENLNFDLEAASAIVPAKPVGLQRSDSISAYMREIARHPLLTREEEQALAERYRATGDVNAAYRLVSANLRLVVKLAHEYHRNPISLLDLIQEGNVGLVQAVKKFEPERGVKLSSYAAWWIRAYILRYIMDNWRMVKLGTTEAQRKLFFKLRQEQNKLAAQGIEVTPKLLAERLSVTEADVVEMDQRLSNDEMSIDAPMTPGDDGGNTRADFFLPSSTVGADEQLADSQVKSLFKRKLDEFAATLSEKDRFIFEKRLIADEPLTLQDVGAQYGVSRERARQIEAALIVRMREFMKQEVPELVLSADAEEDV